MGCVRAMIAGFASLASAPVPDAALAFVGASFEAPATTPFEAPFEAWMAEGAELAEQGRFIASRQRFSASYEAMPPELRVGELGRFAVEQAVASYQQGHLERAESEAVLDLVNRYFSDLQEARARGARTVPSGPEESALLALQEDLQAQTARPSHPTAFATESTPERNGVDELSASEPRARHRLRPLSIGLLVSGSLLTAAGVPLFVQGLRFPTLVDRSIRDGQDAARREMMNDPSLDFPNGAIDTYRDENLRVGRILTGIGAGVLTVGVALLVWGTVRAVRDSKSISSPMTTSAATLALRF